MGSALLSGATWIAATFCFYAFWGFRKMRRQRERDALSSAPWDPPRGSTAPDDSIARPSVSNAAPDPVPAHPTVNDPSDFRSDAISVATVLYTEQSALARHHEEQRAVAATITLSIGTVLLSVISALYTIGAPSAIVIVFLAVALLALSFFGSALSAKHFERSVHSFEQANGFRDCLIALVSPSEVKELMDVGELHTRDRLAHALKDSGTALMVRSEGGGPLKSARDELAQTDVSDMNPLRPEAYTTPLVNGRQRWWRFRLAQPRFDLFRIWNALHVFFGILALAIIGYAILTETNDPNTNFQIQTSPPSGEASFHP